MAEKMDIWKKIRESLIALVVCAGFAILTTLLNNSKTPLFPWPDWVYITIAAVLFVVAIIWIWHE